MNMQALIKGMNAQWQRERAETQMTLGKMIAALEKMPADAMIDGIRHPHSYRGYYSDLAFERAKGKTSVADALAMCKGAMGQDFTGYKGGDYVMGALTPLWMAYYGSTGDKIMDILPDGIIETAEDE
jgi:hypothetical protein